MCHSAHRSSSMAPVYVLSCTSCVESTPNMTEKKKEVTIISGEHLGRPRLLEILRHFLQSCTKPRASLHPLLRGDRHRRKRQRLSLLWKDDSMYNCHSDQELELLQRHHREASETKTGFFKSAKYMAFP